MSTNVVCTPTVIPLCLPSYYRGRPCLTPTTHIEINCDTPGARLFYTVNGRTPEPLEGWQLHDVTWPYDDPFTLSTHDGGYRPGFRTIRAVAMDASMNKRSSVITKIFYVLPSEEQKRGRSPRGKRVRTSNRHLSTGDPIRPLSVVAGTEDLNEMTVTIPKSKLRESSSRWKRLVSLSFRNRAAIERFKSLQELNEIIDVTDGAKTEEATGVFSTSDVEGFNSERRTSFVVIPEVEEPAFEQYADDKPFVVDDGGLVYSNDGEVERDIGYEAHKAHREHDVDSYRQNDDGGGGSRLGHNVDDERGERFSTLEVKLTSELDLRDIDSLRKKGHVRFVDLVENTTPENDIGDICIQEIESGLTENDTRIVSSANSKDTVLVVSRATQSDVGSILSTHFLQSVDCGIQCQIDLNESDEAAEPNTENIEMTLEEAEEQRVVESVATQTEAPEEACAPPPVETASVGVGHDAVATDSKCSQTTARVLLLEQKAVQTEPRSFSAIFDNDALGPRRRSSIKVSPGRGYWRQQIDHIAKELKTQADNSLEFRAMIAEPRMTGIKRVIVHEGLNEMVLVINVGLRSHPEWCCE